MLFMGGLMGGAQMLTFAMVKEGQAKDVSGTVIAFTNMIGIGGALIFQPLTGLIIDITGGVFGVALLMIPLSLLASAAMALVLVEKRHPDHVDKASY